MFIIRCNFFIKTVDEALKNGRTLSSALKSFDEERTKKEIEKKNVLFFKYKD